MQTDSQIAGASVTRALHNDADPQAPHQYSFAGRGQLRLTHIPLVRNCFVDAAEFDVPRIPSESGHKILAKLSRLTRRLCQERADDGDGFFVHLHEGDLLAPDESRPISARTWALSHEILTKLSVSTWQTDSSPPDERRVVAVYISHSHTVIAPDEKTATGFPMALVSALLPQCCNIRIGFVGLIFSWISCFARGMRGGVWRTSTQDAVASARRIVLFKVAGPFKKPGFEIDSHDWSRSSAG